MRTIFAAGCLVVGALFLPACSGSTADQDATTEVPVTSSPTAATGTSVSVQVSVPPAPVQTGAKQVRLDPCVSVGDDLVARAGFTPETRERATSEGVGIFTEIGCQFWRETLVDGEKLPTSAVSVTSSDLTLDDIRKNPAHEVFSSEPIGGRAALLYRTPANPGACSAAVESTDGVFRVGIMTLPAVQAPPPCDEISRITEILSESLGTN
ncbi:DUF3558 domain-containing protein [Nocardia cyriacigeorgica]|uniref:DUF3558 domain-containing protein n=1 Tax=Nocardia cyriacigeorgica TaxID=135487 RepID=UPI001893C488|nr:DUF3558 domain-containing protein [Nocardia cyriacigeorgica]MBF6086912.1 DUF3558 domain-containing protein [Nocardia cyriacigeorgica]